MPIYEYGCKKCGHELEEWQKISESPKKVCPNCGKRSLVRLISNTSFHLKGSGWYVTDYAGKKAPSSNKKESKPKKTTKKESSD